MASVRGHISRATPWLSLRSPGGLAVDFVIDTGFTGVLAGSTDALIGWKLERVGRGTMRLAGGEIIDTTLSTCTIECMGRSTEVTFVDLGPGSTCLIGCGLLGDSRLTLWKDAILVESLVRAPRGWREGPRTAP